MARGNESAPDRLIGMGAQAPYGSCYRVVGRRPGVAGVGSPLGGNPQGRCAGLAGVKRPRRAERSGQAPGPRGMGAAAPYESCYTVVGSDTHSAPRGRKGLKMSISTCTYRTNRQIKGRRMAQADAAKTRLLATLMPTMRDRWTVVRKTVAQMGAEFAAAKLAMIATGRSGSGAEDLTDAEIGRVVGLEFAGVIEPEAWEEGEIGELITPAQGADFSLSLAELRRGEMVCVLQTPEGDLLAVPYR